MVDICNYFLHRYMIVYNFFNFFIIIKGLHVSSYSIDLHMHVLLHMELVSILKLSG